ncbi:MAG: hypothetical protein ACTSPV_13175, partial [Candidatus Hodarchaeales archaeon]
MFSANILIMDLIGFGIAIEFIYRSKDTRFKYIAFGWFGWILAALSFLFWNISLDINNLIIILNSGLNTFGTFLIAIGMLHYFYKVSFHKIVLPISLFLLLHPFIVYLFTGYNHIIAAFTSLFCSNVILITLLTLGYIHRHSLKIKISDSLTWLVLTVLFSLSHMILIFLNVVEMFSQDDVFLHLFVTVMYIILLIYGEHNIQTEEKFALKD